MGVSFTPAASPTALKAIRALFGDGRCTYAVARRLMIWRGCSTRTFVAGSTTMVGSAPLLSTQPSGTWNDIWLDGPRESTNPCVGISGDPDIGCCALHSANLGCSLIGPWFMDMAE